MIGRAELMDSICLWVITVFGTIFKATPTYQPRQPIIKIISNLLNLDLEKLIPLTQVNFTKALLMTTMMQRTINTKNGQIQLI